MSHQAAFMSSTPVVAQRISFPLPLEIRRIIYHFAIVEPQPLPLIPHFYHFGPMDSYMVDAYGVEKDLRMLETCREFRAEMTDVFYSQNSFSHTVGIVDDEKKQLCKVNLKFVQNLHVSFLDMTNRPFTIRGSQRHDGAFAFQCALVEGFASRDYQLKHLVVECESQRSDALATHLHPLSLLRNVSSVQLRCRDFGIQLYFAYLIIVMRSNLPVPFTRINDCWRRLVKWNVAIHPDGPPGETDIDTIPIVAEEHEEQMDAATRRLYSRFDLWFHFTPYTVSQRQRILQVFDRLPRENG